MPEAVSKRLQVASNLLKSGQTEKAIEFAAPVLTEVNSHTINFLSELRYKNSEVADRTFAMLLSRAEADAESDANTVSLELLEDAVREVNRVESNKPDRAVLLVGIANQLIGADRVRAWEIVGEAVKEANRFEDYTGENTLTFPLMTGNVVTMISIGGENYSLAKIFRALAKDDLYRAVDVAKTFKYDTPRAAVTLAIAGAILENKSK